MNFFSTKNNKGFTRTPTLTLFCFFKKVFSEININLREFFTISCFQRQNKKAMSKLVSGFMMVEVLIALSIIVVSILAAMGVTQKSVSVSRQSLHAAQAAFLLEEGTEAMRILRDNNWSNVSGLNPINTYYFSFSGTTWSVSEAPSQIGIFTRTARVDSVNRDAVTGDISISGTNDPGTKLITITVSWSESGRVVSKNLMFYLSDIFS